MIADENNYKYIITFAELPDGPVALTTKNNKHKEWLLNEYNINEELYEDTIRGYIGGNTIVFFKGSDNKPVNDNNAILRIVRHLGKLAENKVIYDGNNKSKIANECELINISNTQN